MLTHFCAWKTVHMDALYTCNHLDVEWERDTSERHKKPSAHPYNLATVTRKQETGCWGSGGAARMQPVSKEDNVVMRGVALCKCHTQKKKRKKKKETLLMSSWNLVHFNQLDSEFIICHFQVVQSINQMLKMWPFCRILMHLWKHMPVCIEM